ncbi:MAG: AbrB family transcriptional regulator [Symploca sp. SIO1C4]|uniref:AbrB family transcriptional regulator n=1 Tax=Symploca sp. SIO1C4 TaxID=2607765 RepID=A0A6B3NC06_9CYAN|nr:AbrB family transcriptional regulator [Symploca sp. SIO1C4]
MLLALPFGLVFIKLGLTSVAWIFGGILSGVLVFETHYLLYHNYFNQNKTARKIGQSLLGLAIGFSIADANLAGAYSKLHIFIFLTLFMLLSGSIIGYIYSRLSQTNLLNAMLATVPGGVLTMSSIAADYGRNVSLVALVQLIRVTSVILIIPLIAGASVAQVSNRTVPTIGDYAINSNPSYLLLLSLAIILALGGVKIAKILRMPAPPFFGTLIIGISFNYLVNLLPFLPELYFIPPLSMSLIGQILLGVTVGEYWGGQKNLDRQTIRYAFIPVVMTILTGFIAAVIAMSVTPWDWLTCMLLTAPGGSTEMILVALALNHNAEIVAVAHVVRLIALNLSLPLWVFLFQYFDQRLAASGNK